MEDLVGGFVYTVCYGFYDYYSVCCLCYLLFVCSIFACALSVLQYLYPFYIYLDSFLYIYVVE